MLSSGSENIGVPTSALSYDTISGVDKLRCPETMTFSSFSPKSDAHSMRYDCTNCCV